MNKLIQADGVVKDIKPANGKTYSLKELQEFVGGYIELVSLPDNLIMLVNEEGYNENLPPNNSVRLLFNKQIVGNAVVCPRDFLD
jgi:hypothetical protein